jgi:hypothetical protein
MKLTIVPDDKAVYVDGLAIFGFDMSPVPSNIHALQWKANIGWLEYVDADDGSKPQNQVITEIPDWATTLYNEWLTQKADNDARAAAAAARTQPTTTGTQTL